MKFGHYLVVYKTVATLFLRIFQSRGKKSSYFGEKLWLFYDNIHKINSTINSAKAWSKHSYEKKGI